jgi:hypothetical protein
MDTAANPDAAVDDDGAKNSMEIRHAVYPIPQISRSQQRRGASPVLRDIRYGSEDSR